MPIRDACAVSRFFRHAATRRPPGIIFATPPPAAFSPCQPYALPLSRLLSPLFAFSPAAATPPPPRHTPLRRRRRVFIIAATPPLPAAIVDCAIIYIIFSFHYSPDAAARRHCHAADANTCRCRRHFIDCPLSPMPIAAISGFRFRHCRDAIDIYADAIHAIFANICRCRHLLEAAAIAPSPAIFHRLCRHAFATRHFAHGFASCRQMPPASCSALIFFHHMPRRAATPLAIFHHAFLPSIFRCPFSLSATFILYLRRHAFDMPRRYDLRHSAAIDIAAAAMPPCRHFRPF